MRPRLTPPTRAVVLAIAAASFTLACQSSTGGDGNDPGHPPSTWGPAPAAQVPAEGWRSEFTVPRDRLGLVGSNPYFDLTPGVTHVYADGDATLTIRVLDESRLVDGVATRVVEEREDVRGQVKEVSRNFFAYDRATGDVYYFGEEVDEYENGVLARHPGAWLSGVGGARFGLAMPARPVIGDRYYQEIAPGIAMDRAEVVSLDDALRTGAGMFAGCVRVRETTPLEPGAEYKWYAPGVGLVKDGDAVLSSRAAAAMPTK